MSETIYALNVQAIVDSKKRFLYAHVGSVGSANDSRAFQESCLRSEVDDIADFLFYLGYHLIGDSAYALTTYMWTPFENPRYKSPQDNYNYYHSSCRIAVECAFG